MGLKEGPLEENTMVKGSPVTMLRVSNADKTALSAATQCLRKLQWVSSWLFNACQWAKPV